MSTITTTAPPSGNAADYSSLNGVLRLWMTKFLQQVDDMLPAQVIAYDAASNTAQVQPLISFVTTSNQVVQRAQVASVPVLQLSGGGFLLNFPINSGDLGWIKSNDRDISLFMQTGEVSPPNTQRKHSFEDAIFIPQAARSLITIDSQDAANVVLQNYAGTCKISISQTNITVTAPNGVTVDTPIATFTKDVEIDGILIVNNVNSQATPCTINGNISTNGDVIASSISLVNHVHSGVTTGGGDTGKPV